MEAKRYIMRREFVDAIIFDGHNISLCRKLAGDENRLTIDADSRLSRSMILSTPKGSTLVQVGDWLVKDSNFHINIYTDKYFKAVYEVLE